MKCTLATGAGCLAVFLFLGAGAAARQAADGGHQVVITVQGHHGAEAPPLSSAQISVQQGRDHDAVTGLERLDDGAAGMDLVLALDEDARNLGSRLDDIKAFLAALPTSTRIELAYLHTGTFSVAQPLSADHSLAVAALRAPSGVENVSPSPYGSLQALLRSWPADAGRRRELILLSDGIEHVAGNNGNNLTFQQAVADAVGYGVVVYTIYVTGAAEQLAANTVSNAPNVEDVPEYGTPLGGAGGSGMGKLGNFPTAAVGTALGSTNLAQLAQATGGEGYTQNNQTPTRFQPFLSDIAGRMRAQYRLTFTPTGTGAGGLVGVKIELKNAHGAELTAPRQIYLPKPH